ncbi:MAG: acVLRF1 family peptidyl-tRNA hydrolase [Sporichthyaceae bacterium]
MSQPAPGGRTVEVPPERVVRWFANFADRHGGPVRFEKASSGVFALAANGATADAAAPFAGSWRPLGSGDELVARLAAHAAAPRRVGVLLVRLGGYAAGVFDGVTWVVTKVGSRQVHGRTSAGGWSQQRFARRRENQVEVALDSAAEVAARILVPHVGSLAALVVGGERTAIDRVLADRRLAALAALPREPRVLGVPDPKQAVLFSTPPMFRAVSIKVVDPTG